MRKRTAARAWAKRRDMASRSQFAGLSQQQIDEKLAALQQRERALLLDAGRPGPTAESSELRQLRNQLDKLQVARPFRLRDAFFGARISEEERRLSREIRDMEIAARQAADAAADRAEKARAELASVRASIRAGKAVIREMTDERIRAQAAAHRGQTREPAGALRRRSAVPERCPYCLRPSMAWELDHIHPVSKGGLSVDANCVMVCADCNSTKGTLLLRQFCRKRGLEFEAVITRLEAMGKDV